MRKYILALLLILRACNPLLGQYPTGFILPSQEEIGEIKTERVQIFGLAMDDIDKLDHFDLDRSGDRSFDLRTHNLVTPIRNQGPSCGSCWAFATATAIESSYLLRNGRSIDVAENQFLFCSNSGSCGGGRMDKLLAWLEQTNTTIKMENESPYDPFFPRPVGGCNDGQENVKVVNFGFVSQNPWLPSGIAEIKSALCKHGAIVTSLVSTDQLQSYHGGYVYNQPLPGVQTNHAIAIIGWDDDKNAWLIKNSWSENWGDKGYAWINYNSSNIGVLSLWVDVNVTNRNENPTNNDIGSATITVSDRLDGNDEVGEQVYEEIYLTINNREYVYTLSKGSSSNEVKTITLPHAGDYPFSVRSMTHFLKNERMNVKSGTGSGTLSVTNGAAFELKVASFINDSQYKVKIVKKP